MNKKTVSFAAVLVLLTVVLAACGSSSKGQFVKGKVNVVTSFYPLYFFTQSIGGDHVNAINLVPAGVEPHEWSPKSKDLSNMTKAQMFVYQGAGFEGWVDDFLSSLKKDSGPKVVEASKGVNLIKADNIHPDQKKSNESDIDPHTWLSPVNAKKMGENIRDGLIAADPANKADYEANYNSFAGKMDALDAKYKETLAKTSKKEIAVTHQAFAYLCRDYSLVQMPIMGLAPDSEPTAKDLQQVNQFIKEHNLKYIFFEDLVSDKLAKTLAKDANVDTLVLNPLEGLTEEQQKAGENYITIMEKNLQTLTKALQ